MLQEPEPKDLAIATVMTYSSTQSVAFTELGLVATRVSPLTLTLLRVLPRRLRLTMQYLSPTFVCRSRRFGRLCLLLMVTLTICLLFGVAWIARAPLLQSAARWWILSEEQLTPADAVVVLGGGIETRPFAAAAYYHKGLTRKILVSDVRLTRSERLGIFLPQRDLNQIVLMQLGVPKEAIEALGTANRNTRDEALALRQWADRTHARSVIVPTEIFSSRRVKWMMESALNGAGVQVQVPALDSADYGQDDWWQYESGLVTFQNEALKYLYYQWKY